MSVQAIESGPADAYEAAKTWVLEEVRGAVGNAAPGTTAFARAFALSAFTYVYSRMSSARYALLNRAGHQFDVGMKAIDSLLELGVGLCGHHTDVFLRLARDVGVEARAIQTFFEDATGTVQSHIFPEVRWDDAWHMLDTSFGWYPFGDNRILSFDEVAAGQPYAVEGHLLSLWHQQWARHASYLEYVRAKGLGRLIGGAGTLTARARPEDEGLALDFEGLPKYVGHASVSTGETGELVWRVPLEPGRWRVEATVQPWSGLKALRIGDTVVGDLRPSVPQSVTAEVDGAFEFAAADGDRGYALIDAFSIRPAGTEAELSPGAKRSSRKRS